VLLLLLTLVIALVYVSRVGLPAFLKAPLLAELQRRGLEAQCDRLAWRWYRGLVAEGAMLRATNDPNSPRAYAAELALNLNWGRLLRDRTLELDSLRVVGGRLVLPLQEPGQPPEDCSLETIGANVRFLPGGEWELSGFETSFLGATFQASGTLTNARALISRPRDSTGKRPPGASVAWRGPLRDFVAFHKRLSFVEPPELRLWFRGDGRQPGASVCELKGQVGGAKTPWLNLRDLRWALEVNQPPAADGHLAVTLRLNVADGRPPWGELRQATLTAKTLLAATNFLPRRVDWELSAREARTPKAGLSTAQVTGQSELLTTAGHTWRTRLELAAGGVTTVWGHAHTNRCVATFDHSLTNLLPSVLDLSAELEALDTRWGEISSARLCTRVASLANAPAKADPAWGPWATLAGYAASWQIRATNLHQPRLALDHFAVDGEWRAPQLVLTNLHARLYGGSLEVPTARLDVATRAVETRLNLDFDAHAVAPLLGAGVEAWLAQFRWSHPPPVTATARAVLPPWTNRPPNSAKNLFRSLVAQARIEGRDVAYLEVPIQAAALSVGLSNEVLSLRDFRVVRPEGDADLSYDLHTTSQEFRWRLRAHLDPKGVGPAIDRDAPRLLSLFEFNGPAAVTGEVWGRWGPDKEINLALGGVVTNFTFRGEPIDELRVGVRLTNQFLTATHVSLGTGAEWIRAVGIGVDLTESWVYITNAEAEIDPLRFARAIGSNLVNTLSPYRFDRPPRVRAEGRVPAQGSVDAADMRFSVAGGPFHFWRFNVPDLDGQVHWEGERVTLTNVVCGFYGGQLRGQLRADIQSDGSAELAFRASVTNVSLQPLVLDTIPTTNRIEGTLHGMLDLTRANSADWKSWNGSGRLQMRDGLLWDLPFFRILSPMLNAVVPGLGNSRARAATGSFTITNSVMRTDDLEIMAQPVRLAYRGTLDFDWNIRAQVEAEIIPGAPLIGPLLNIFLAPVSKALIYKVRGTLGDPELEPLLVPKFLLPALRPFQTIRGVFSKPSSPSGTNAPTTGKP
jgi:hypothetical protein